MCKKTILLTFAVFYSVAVLAQQIVLGDDGREVQLNSDGSWHYISKDKYATSSDGRRFQLYPDGSWREIKQEDVVINKSKKNTKNPERKIIYNERPLEASPSETLNNESFQAIINNVKLYKSLVKTLKSSRIETQMQFDVTVINRSAEPLDLSQLSNRSFEVVSSKNEKFKVIDVSISKSSIQPGKQAKVEVRTDGSPNWFGVKYISLIFKKDALGQSVKYVLNKNFDEIERIKVDALN